MKRLIAILSLSLLLPAQNWAQTGASNRAEGSAADLAEANKLSQQALALYDDRKYSEALPIAKRVVEIREKALGPEHELVAAGLSNVAEIYVSEKKYADAEPLFKRALSILEKKWGNESNHLVITLERIGLISFAQQRNGEAERHYQRALAITEKSFGPQAIETSQSLETLAGLYDRTEQYKKAAELYQRSLGVQEKLLDPSDAQLVNLLYKCACTLIRAGQEGKANEYLERAEKRSPSAPVNQGVLQGIAITRVQPEYPLEARKSRVRGSVLVQVLVDQCGRVITAKALNGHVELVAAALRAAKKWRFSPVRLAGRPIKVIGTITFNFTL
jgi:TonB family protein